MWWMLLVVLGCGDKPGGGADTDADTDADTSADCLLLTEERDNNCDGTINSCYTWTYDSNGNMLTKEYDYGCDGTVEECSTYTYDCP